MKIDEVIIRVERELENISQVRNLHGVTTENLNSFLVRPYEVLVDPDDLETHERKMWVVITAPDMKVAFDPLTSCWSVIEEIKDNKYIQIVYGESIEEALNSM